MANVAVPTAEDVAEKWAGRAGAASAEYAKGVTNPKKDWATQTANAASVFQAAVSAGNMAAKFSSGVKKAGSAKWQNNAKTLGTQRYGSGINNAKPAMAAGIGPMLSTLSQLTIPDRQPRGSAANIDRVRAIADALHAKKVSMQGAGL